MNSGLYLEDQRKYISTKEASSLTGYSQDYIGQLVRGNKISSKKVGRAWYVSEESILNYKNFLNQEGLVLEPKPEIEQNVKKEGKSIFAQTSPLVSTFSPEVTPIATLKKTPQKARLSNTLIFVISVFLVIAGGVSASNLSIPNFFKNIFPKSFLSATSIESSNETTVPSTNINDTSNTYQNNASASSTVNISKLASAYENYLSQGIAKNVSSITSPKTVQIIKASLSDAEIALVLQRLLNQPNILQELRGPAGPQGPSGVSAIQTIASPIYPAAPYIGISPPIYSPNPSINFSGATYSSATNVSSSNLTSTTANISTLNVSGSSNLGALSTTGDENISGNLNVTGDSTIAGKVTVANLVDSGLVNQNCVGTDASGQFQIGTCSGTSQWINSGPNISFSAGNVGIGTISPTALLNIAAGTATANTEPLQFTAGVLNTAAVSGALETDVSNNLYYTPGTATRGIIPLGTAANILLFTTTGNTNVTLPTSGTLLTTTGTAATANALQSATTTVNVSSATAPTTGQVLTATSGTAATWQTPSGGSGLTVGTTAITGGTSGRIEYNNAGVLGEMTTSGSGTVVALTTSPTFTTPNIGNATGNISGNAGTVTSGVYTTGVGTVFQAPISLTTTGSSGAATFSGGTLNIPQYAGTTYSAGTGLTLTSSTFSVNTSQNITTLSNLISNGLVKTSGGSGTLSIATAGTDYQAPVSLTTTGSSGAATFSSNTLNIPSYTLAGLGGQPQLNGTGFVKATGTTISYDNTAYAPLASPTFTGAVTMPTPFTLGATSVTATGTQFNYLAAATGTTGTTSSNLVFSTSPTLTTPNLGTPSTLVGTNITGTAASLTAGITNALASATTTVNVSSATAPTTGQVLTATSGTAATWQTPSGGSGLTVGTTAITGGTSGRIEYNNAGVLGEMTTSGSGTTLALTTSPTFVTPTLGVAIATTLNGNTFTTGTYTLTGTAGKTLTFNNSITLAGTDGTTMTFPSTSASLAPLASPTFTGTATTPALTISGIASGTQCLQVNGSGVVSGTGSTCGVGGGSSDLTVGTTVIASGSSGRIEYNNAGVLGEMTTTGSGTVVALATSPTLTTPVFSGLPTGSGVASGASASTLVARDANANLFGNNFVSGYTTTVTAAGTTTLTVASTYQQYFTGTMTQTVTMPASVPVGQAWYFENNSTGAVTLNATSGANTIIVLAAGTSAILTSTTNTASPTAASWNLVYNSTLVTSGKVFDVSNSLTLAGTDGTTLTFPTSSKTLAANDGSNWTFASQAVGDLPYANSSTSYAKLADVATGSVLISGGVGVAPSWSANPNINTSLTTPTVYGGTGASSTLTLAGTSNGSPSNAYVLLNPSGQGNVGVGTASPTHLFEVDASSPSTPVVYLTNNNVGAALEAYNSSFGYGIDAESNASSAITANNFTSSTPTLQTYNWAGGPSAVFRGGNVGIGTISPTALLNIAAGTATANTEPLQFTAGVLNTAAVSGALETDVSNNLYYTPGTATRGIIPLGTAANILLFTTTGNTNVTLPTSGTLATNSGSNWTFASQAVGDLPYANSSTSYAKLADVATGSVLISGGVGVAPSWSSTPSFVGTNITGVPISTGISGLGTGIATFLATPSSANLASAVADATGSGALVFATSPTLTTPVFSGLPTGSGVASGASASTLVARDANANLFGNNFVSGYTTTVTAAGTTTLTVASTYQQYFTGTMTQTVTMPASVPVGQAWYFENNSTGAVTLNATSGANTIIVLAAGTSAILTSTTNTASPTAASWNLVYNSTLVTSGKVFDVSNSLTLAGTDGTTLTFPTSSKTLAANDGSNWTFASQAVGDLPYANSSTSYAKLADVATGSVLISGGVGVAPSWSANPNINTSLTTPTVYGGTGASSTLTLAGTSNGSPSNAYVLLNPSGQGNVGVGTASPPALLSVGSGSPFQVSSLGSITTSAAGAASTPALSITGAPYTAGNGTTNYPLLYLNDGTGPGGLSGSGTEFGINAPSGFTGNLVDLHINGAAPVFKITSAGNVTEAAVAGGTYNSITLNETSSNLTVNSSGTSAGSGGGDTTMGSGVGNGTGANDSFFGDNVGTSASSTSDNSGFGSGALQSQSTGINNAAFGDTALTSELHGSNNTAIGLSSLYNIVGTSVTAGSFVVGQTYTIATVGTTNFVAIGASASTIGVVFTATGVGSGTGTANISNDVGLGYYAGYYISGGSTANTTSYDSTYLGYNTEPSANGDANETVIGYNAVGNGSNTVTLANSSVTGYYLGSSPSSSSTGDYICIDSSTHQLYAGTAVCSLSSERFKTNIQDLAVAGTVQNPGVISPNGDAPSTPPTDLLAEVMSLRPVSFEYKQGYGDSGATVQLGFVAEEAVKLDPRLVVFDSQGLPSGFNYPTYTAVLTSAVQEMNLNLDSIAGIATPVPGSEPDTFMTAFFNNLENVIGNWLADAGNGIGNIFAGSITVKNELCINATCITQSQLQEVLQNLNSNGGGTATATQSSSTTDTANNTGDTTTSDSSSTASSQSSTPPALAPTSSDSSATTSNTTTDTANDTGDTTISNNSSTTSSDSTNLQQTSSGSSDVSITPGTSSSSNTSTTTSDSSSTASSQSSTPPALAPAPTTPDTSNQ